MGLQNAKQVPQIFYGLHMVPGLCKYPEKDNLMVLLREETTKSMDATFPGKPVYVQHVEDVDLDNIQSESAGYVVESFFNKWDGAHWVKFIVVSDEGHEAIRKKWRLSNSYGVKGFGAGGEYHAVPFTKEVTNAEYDHLAIVPNPRYEESIILTPEEFKAYNLKKEQELLRLANSKDEENKENGSMKFNFFKKSKLDNAKELNLEDISVELPKSKKEKTITQLVNAMDEIEMNAMSSEPKFANQEDMVQMSEKETMLLKDLVEFYNTHKAKNDTDEADVDAELEADDSLQNEEESDEDKKKKADEKLANDKKAADKAKADAAAAAKKKENFEKLKNAAAQAEAEKNVQTIFTSTDQAELGKSRYGSK